MADYIIPFGKHKGITLSSVPKEYLKYLCDYEIDVDEDGKVKRTDKLQDEIDTLCENCEFYMDQCTDKALDSEYFSKLSDLNMCSTGIGAKYLLDSRVLWMPDDGKPGFKIFWPRVWLWANEKKTIDHARMYVRDHHLCCQCFSYMPPVGYDRSNGKAHDDWDGRFLHKHCWRQLILNNS